MKHLAIEEIASLAEGNISGPEHEKFLKHLAECEECFKAYANTLKFVEEEKVGTSRWKRLKVPGIGKIRGRLRLPDVNLIFPKKVLVPAAAVLLVVLLIIPSILKMFHLREIRNEQKQHIASIVVAIEDSGIHGFTGHKEKVYAAVRAGIFLEDLSLIIKTSDDEELRTKIGSLLRDELNKCAKESETISPLPEPVNIGKEDIGKIMQCIEKFVENRSLSAPFRLGRFVEKSLLAAFESRLPLAEDIEKFIQVTQEPDLDLPEGVFKELQKLQAATDIKVSKNICIAIKEIFLFSE